MATNPNKVAKVVTATDEQVDTLANGGSITKGGNTFTADEDTLYLTEEQPVVITSSTAPTTSTVGYVGQFYLDTATPKLYQCTAVTALGTNPETYSYTWSNVDKGYDVISGSSDPTSSVIGEVGQLYINTSTSSVWICLRTASNSSFWYNLGGTGGNTSNSNNNFVIGGTVNPSTRNRNVVIGYKASTWNTDDAVAIGGGSTDLNAAYVSGSYGVAVGSGAMVGTSSDEGISIGYKAKSGTSKTRAIQIGQGTNNVANTLQIRDDNIYNHNSHTATFTNIQQGVNNTDGSGGVPVYGVLSGLTAPTNATVGGVGQFYLDTVTGKLYKCDAVTTVSDVTTYTWTPVGGSIEIVDL